MARLLQKRKSRNNDDIYLVINALSKDGSEIEMMALNTTNGIAKRVTDYELDEQLPIIVENDLKA